MIQHNENMSKFKVLSCFRMLFYNARCFVAWIIHVMCCIGVSMCVYIHTKVFVFLHQMTHLILLTAFESTERRSYDIAMQLHGCYSRWYVSDSLTVPITDACSEHTEVHVWQKANICFINVFIDVMFVVQWFNTSMNDVCSMHYAIWSCSMQCLFNRLFVRLQ